MVSNSHVTYENMTRLGENVPSNPPPKRAHDKGSDEIHTRACPSRDEFRVVGGIGVGASIGDTEGKLEK